MQSAESAPGAARKVVIAGGGTIGVGESTVTPIVTFEDAWGPGKR
jgi:hypothetical protein